MYDLYASIEYHEAFEYANFDVDNQYSLDAVFDTVEGRWEVQNIHFKGREYYNYRFAGYYYYEPSGWYISSDDGLYLVVLENIEEEIQTIDLGITGYIDYGYGEAIYEVKQTGNKTVEIYDIDCLPEDIINAVQYDFSGYLTAGSVSSAFDLDTYEPAVLMITQCNMLSRYSPEKNYNVYILVMPDECWIGVKETSNTDKFKTRLLTRDERY